MRDLTHSITKKTSDFSDFWIFCRPVKNQNKRLMKLGELAKGGQGLIVKVGAEGSSALAHRLMEMGLLVGSRVELVHEAPFGKDPVAVRVRGALVALRRNEANIVEVEAL